MSDAAADDIREDIEATRADLDEKIHQLTEKAHEVVDVRLQVARRPWVALAVATAAGFFLGGRRRPAYAPAHLAAPQTLLNGRPNLGFLTEAAVLVVTSVAKSALRNRLQSVGTDGERDDRRRNRAAGVRSVRERSNSSTRNGDQLG